MNAKRTALGIELGSTRIKATLVELDGSPIGSGSFAWENRLEDGVWTYDLGDAWHGIGACVTDLAQSLPTGASLESVAALGISGMMHGYVALDVDDQLLVPFRTWRNNITGDAAAELTQLFGYPVPQRWSIAHLYQAILNGEQHLPEIAKLTTLAGYIHYGLTGEHVLGVGEASGVFPIDAGSGDYDQGMVDKFDALIAGRGFSWKLRDLLPAVLPAGKRAGTLSAAGAARLDAAGSISAGIPLCPPEGDAGTGMIATNAVRPRGGNVSAGTSVFAMLVLERPLSGVHKEIDLVSTPDGSPVAMVHSNNCTSDIDAWIVMLVEAANTLGAEASLDEGFAKLLPQALSGDTAGLLSFGYVSGEHLTGFSEGRPLFARDPATKLTLAGLLRSHLFGSLCAMRTGLDILTEREKVEIDEIRGHGGFFKTPEVGQRIMAAAVRAPVSVMETAGEGGPWGMALLAAYMLDGAGKSLPDFLDRLFANYSSSTLEPRESDAREFAEYFARYTAALPIERAAVETIATKAP